MTVNRERLMYYLMEKYDLTTIRDRLPALAVRARRQGGATPAEIDRWIAEAGGPHESRPIIRAEKPKPPKTYRAVVYYLRFDSRIKIGTTMDLRQRLTQVPHDELLGCEPGSRPLEQQRHEEFAHLRVHGEWFRAEPELLGFIEGLPG